MFDKLTCRTKVTVGVSIAGCVSVVNTVYCMIYVCPALIFFPSQLAVDFPVLLLVLVLLFMPQESPCCHV